MINRYPLSFKAQKSYSFSMNPADQIGEIFRETCEMLFLCGSCGTTMFGKDISVEAGIVDYMARIPSFFCACGGELEPMTRAKDSL